MQTRALALAFVAALVLGAACNSTDTTSTPGILAVPVLITTDIKASTSFPANAPVVVHARVTRGGIALPGVPVTWAIAAGHGKLSASTATTDTAGSAAVTWTLSDTAGLNSLAIGSSGVADTLHLIGVIGQPSGLIVVGNNAST